MARGIVVLDAGDQGEEFLESALRGHTIGRDFNIDVYQLWFLDSLFRSFL